MIKMYTARIFVRRIDSDHYKVTGVELWDMDGRNVWDVLDDMIDQVYPSKAEIRDAVRELVDDLVEIIINDE